MRFLIIAGHGGSDPGACYLGYKEHDIAVELAKLLKTELSRYGTVEIADTSIGWYRHICKNGGKFNFKPYDYVLELHLNAAANDLKGNKRTTGSEIYVTTSEKVVAVEENILKGMEILGFKNRGVKAKNWGLISYIKKQGVSAALMEVCFLDDKDDMDLYQARKKDIAFAIAEGIAKGYELSGDSLSSACKLLSDKVIINSPDYWAKGNGYSDANTVTLIKKFANYVRGR
jgi:N-acetylmuramoyl-L-alanine amidase